MTNKIIIPVFFPLNKKPNDKIDIILKTTKKNYIPDYVDSYQSITSNIIIAKISLNNSHKINQDGNLKYGYIYTKNYLENMIKNETHI